jgi:hypothetical protein
LHIAKFRNFKSWKCENIKIVHIYFFPLQIWYNLEFQIGSNWIWILCVLRQILTTGPISCVSKENYQNWNKNSKLH